MQTSPRPKPVQTRPTLVKMRPRKRHRAKHFMRNLPSKTRTPVAPGLSIVAVVAVFGCATPGAPIVEPEAEAGRGDLAQHVER